MTAARFNHLAMDRPDILYAKKEIAKQMPRPREQHLGATEANGQVSEEGPSIDSDVGVAQQNY